MRGIIAWLDDRLGFSQTVKPLIEHPVPPTGWDYTIGSATLIAFIVQVVTGVALAFSYVPTPDHAYESLEFITNEAILGGIVRGIHFWGASAMVLLVCMHAAQVFLVGAFKYPREVNWLRHAAAGVHLRHGLYGPTTALEPGCVLGSSRGRRSGSEGATDRRLADRHSVRRPISGRRHPDQVLRHARVHDPSRDLRPTRPAPVPGHPPRRFRAARAWRGRRQEDLPPEVRRVGAQDRRAVLARRWLERCRVCLGRRLGGAAAGDRLGRP